MKVTRVFSSTAFAGLLLSMGASSAMAQDDAIERRQKLMKGFSAAAKEVKAAVENKDYTTVAVKVKDIADSLDMAAFAKNWPHNSTDAKSRAKAEVWQKWNDFMLTAWDGQQRALSLVDAAKSKNDAKVAEAFKAFGPVCVDCHKSFRAEAAKSTK